MKLNTFQQVTMKSLITSGAGELSSLKVSSRILDKVVVSRHAYSRLVTGVVRNTVKQVAFKNQECACFWFELSADVPSKTHSKRIEMKVATVGCGTNPIDCSDVTVSVVVRKDLLVFPIVNKPRVTLRHYFSAD